MMGFCLGKGEFVRYGILTCKLILRHEASMQLLPGRYAARLNGRICMMMVVAKEADLQAVGFTFCSRPIGSRCFAFIWEACILLRGASKPSKQ